VTAKNGVGNTTLNYDGVLGGSKQVTLTAASSVGGAVSALGNITFGTFPASSFVAGSSSVTAPKPVFTFTTVPTVPTDIYLRATDTDNATSLQSPAASSIE
jgi:hypothetical protein